VEALTVAALERLVRHEVRELVDRG
jgi:hypothetical protein